jgi:dihydroorotate dehydrogenase electron transfer subunit
MTKVKTTLELKSNHALNADTYLLTLDAPAALAAGCRPGQFFNIQPLHSTAPLLRRPISICDARENEIDFIVKDVGQGTHVLAENPPKSQIDIVGPLGNTFTYDADRPALLVAGGVGVAPLYYLASDMTRGAKRPPNIAFCYGARDKAGFVLTDKIPNVVDELLLATEDGSEGHRGYVTGLIEDRLDTGLQIFVCGPPVMMQTVLEMLQERKLTGQISLENQMGCGVGACQGCVVPGRHGHIRVCCDGPVISSDELDRILIH